MSKPAELTVPPELAALDQYRIERELGRGGMGVVYLARNRTMDRPEVLKVLHPHLLETAGAERFLREVRAAARLNHPNVVTAYHAFMAGRYLVFAMEYAPGADLDRLVKTRGPLPVANACYYAQQAAAALQHAHEKGMVHRDIKPHNLILVREGKRHAVKILDFGLAKAASEDRAEVGAAAGGGAAAPAASADLTSYGQVLGTPAYLAPEQAADPRTADIRADLYGLGCTLHFLLTGRPPFRASSLAELLNHHRSTPPESLSVARPDVPPALAELVGRMLAKSPDERFQSPDEVVKALVPFVRGGTGAAPSSPTAAGSAPPAAQVTTAVPAGTVVAEPAVWHDLTVDPGAESKSEAAADSPRRRAPPAQTMWLVWGGIAAGAAVGAVLLAAWAGGAFSSRSPDEAAEAPAAPAPKPAPAKPAAKALIPPAPERMATFSNKGGWYISNDALVSAGSRAQGWVRFGNPEWEDYDFSFSVEKVSGPEGFSAVFRSDEPNATYLFTLGVFGNRTDCIEVATPGRWFKPGDGSLRRLPRRTNVSLTNGGNYHVRVEVRGSRCRCYLNDDQVFDYAMRDAPTGRVGFRTLSGTVIRLTEISVKDPSGKLLWEGLPVLPD